MDRRDFVISTFACVLEFSAASRVLGQKRAIITAVNSGLPSSILKEGIMQMHIR
jgi:hypothetical protein